LIAKKEEVGLFIAGSSLKKRMDSQARGVTYTLSGPSLEHDFGNFLKNLKIVAPKVCVDFSRIFRNRCVIEIANLKHPVSRDTG
jgi:hypothetical protein